MSLTFETDLRSAFLTVIVARKKGKSDLGSAPFDLFLKPPHYQMQKRTGSRPDQMYHHVVIKAVPVPVVVLSLGAPFGGQMTMQAQCSNEKPGLIYTIVVIHPTNMFQNVYDQFV